MPSGDIDPTVIQISKSVAAPVSLVSTDWDFGKILQYDLIMLATAIIIKVIVAAQRAFCESAVRACRI